MAFCSRCGSEYAADAGFCSKCGSQFGQPALSAQHVAATTPPPVPISESWRRTFALIEKAGGPPKGWQNLIRWAPELTLAEQRAMNFNFPAFMFGPFAYLGYGMWKRAISLTLVAGIVAGLVGSLLDDSSLALSACIGAGVFGTRANTDYYKKVILQDNRWW